MSEALAGKGQHRAPLRAATCFPAECRSRAAAGHDCSWLSPRGLGRLQHEVHLAPQGLPTAQPAGPLPAVSPSKTLYCHHLDLVSVPKAPDVPVNVPAPSRAWVLVPQPNSPISRTSVPFPAVSPLSQRAETLPPHKAKLTALAGLPRARHTWGMAAILSDPRSRPSPMRCRPPRCLYGACLLHNHRLRRAGPRSE